MSRPSQQPLLRTSAACVSIWLVNALAFVLFDASKEGKRIVLGMLATGGVFIGVIALGQLAHWASSRRHKR